MPIFRKLAKIAENNDNNIDPIFLYSWEQNSNAWPAGLPDFS
jgi:hypothetical protein